MKVLFKIPLALGCLVAVYALGVISINQFFIRPSFDALERKDAGNDLDRVVAAVLREGQHLATLGRVWSAWDDTYAFAQDRASAFIDQNLAADSWKQIFVDVMAIYGLERTLLFEGRYDSATNRVMPEALFPPIAPPEAPYLHATDDDDRVVGFVSSPRGVYVLASTPILHTNGSGPVQGSFLMGRLIDPPFAREVSERTSVKAAMFPVCDAGPRETSSILAAGGKTQIVDVSTNEILGSQILRDLWGSPALLVQTRTPREISAQSLMTMRVSFAMILALALVFVAAVSLLLLGTVVRPLGRLQEHVRRAESDPELDAMPSFPSEGDEIGSLASAFTRMSAGLAARRRELQAANESLEAKVRARTQDIMLAEEHLRQLNRLYRATSRVEKLIVREKERARLLQEICRIAVEDGGVIMAWIGFVDASTGSVVPAVWFGREEGYLATIKVAFTDAIHGRGPTGTAIRENRHVFVSDIARDPCMAPWKEEAAQRGYRSSAAFPLTENGTAVGAFSAYAGTVDFFDAPALSLLDELAEDLSYALENLAREEERKKLQGQLQQAQKMEAVGRLAGGIAHDFNNILTVINGYSELGMEDAEGTQKTFFYNIKQAARRAANLTSQLLMFSRKQMVRPRVIDIGEVVSGMADMITRLLGEDIQVQTAREAGLWNVLMDPGQVEQVIMNLAVNARDAMPHGGRLMIRVANARLDGSREVRTGEYVRLEVSDTGHGMDKETMARIYEPFFTTKDVGKGTGLGLATVYGIIRQSGGHIDCRSAPGQGTTFTVFLPRY